MVLALHIGLSVVAREFHSFGFACQDSSLDGSERYCSAFDSGTWYYIVFFLIGIVGYFCVPTVAGWIIEAGGGIGAYGRNVNSVAKSGAQGAYLGGKASAAGMGAAVGNIGGRIKGMLIKGK